MSDHGSRLRLALALGSLALAVAASLWVGSRCVSSPAGGVRIDPDTGALILEQAECVMLWSWSAATRGLLIFWPLMGMVGLVSVLKRWRRLAVVVSVAMLIVAIPLLTTLTVYFLPSGVLMLMASVSFDRAGHA